MSTSFRLLQVRNQSFFGPGAIEHTNGSNGFALVANRVDTPGVCDVRTDATCPQLSARDDLDIFARKETVTADWHLSELGPDLAGAQVQIELWDFAENATALQILEPTNVGSCTTWTFAPQTFDWRLTGPGGSGGPSGSTGWTTGVTSLASDVAFNGMLIEIRFDLPPTWDPPACNRWFKAQASYSSSTQGQDRTTWTVRVIPP